MVLARLLQRGLKLLIIEDFPLRPQSGGKTASDPCELIGRLEATAAQYGDESLMMLRQHPKLRLKAEAKNKLWDEWTGCYNPHCRDAAGHLEAFMRSVPDAKLIHIHDELLELISSQRPSGGL